MPQNGNDSNVPVRRAEPVPGDGYGMRDYSLLPVEAVQADVFSFRTYWQILKHRRSMVIFATVGCTLLATLISFRMKPVYRASARLEVEAEMPQTQSLDYQEHSSATDQTFLQTQVDLLQNDSLAWDTIQQLGLESNPEFNPRGIKITPNNSNSVVMIEDALIRAFKSHLEVQLLRDSRLVEVSFESTNPQLAASGANTVASAFVESSFRSKYNATRVATQWMEQQLDELKAKVEKSQQALVDYEKQNDIVNIGDKENVIQTRLEDLSKDLTVAQTDRAQKQAIWESVKADEQLAGYFSSNGLLQHLEGSLADLNTQYAQMLAQYGPNFYRAVQLQKQIAEVQDLLAKQRKRLVQQAEDDYEASGRREEILQQNVEAQRGEVEKLNQELIGYNLLKGEFETNQQLYNDLLRKLKDATLMASIQATNIRLADRARVPAAPIRPQRSRNIALGLLLGLILGVTAAFIQDALDNSIRTPEDLEKILLPALAMVPFGSSVRRSYGHLRKHQPSQGTPARVAVAVLDNTSSQLSESFRSLRTSILLSMAPRPPQVVLLTSAHPGEGKTCCSTNLAMSLAQRGGKVLLIDADLRKPGISRALSLEGKKGLSSVLTGGDKLEEAIEVYDGLPNLSVLCAGPPPPNPSEIVSSSAMDQLIQALREQYDHIIIDSPPVIVVTDATIISSLADGVVIVVESDYTTRAALERVRKTLDHAGAHILGAILNKANLRQHSEYYGSRYGYYSGYYYGYGKHPDSSQKELQ
jgi:polysaccharide biosynthesis transport protein